MGWEVLGGTLVGPGSVWSPTWRAGRNWEALPEGRSRPGGLPQFQEGSGGSLEGPEGSEAHTEVREGLEGPQGGLGVVGRFFL